MWPGRGLWDQKHILMSVGGHERMTNKSYPSVSRSLPKKSFAGKLGPCLSPPQTPLSNRLDDAIISQGLSHRA